MVRIVCILSVIILLLGCKKNKEEFVPHYALFTVQITNDKDTIQSSAGELIEIQGKLENYTNNPNIKIIWKSDKDGEIKNENASNAKTYDLKTSSLSKNIHKIYLIAINPIGYWSIDSIVVCNMLPKAVVLKNINKDDHSLILSWTKSKENNFSTYEVYRSSGENAYKNGVKIDEITDIIDTTFTDTTVFLGNTYHYQVIVKDSGNYRMPSNELKDEAGIYKEFGKIYKMMKDPNRDLVYILSDGLKIINTQALVLDKVFDVVGSDFDLDKAGNYLYLAGGWQNIIQKIGLDNKQIVSVKNIGKFVNRIGCGRGNRLYFHQGPNESSNPVYALDTAGSIVGSYTRYGGVASGDFKVHPNGNYLYVAESYTSGDGLIMFDISTDNVQYISEFPHGYAQAFLRISHNGSMIYWENMLLDETLKIIKSPIDIIFDFSANDNLAISGNKIMEIATGKIVKTIPINFKDALFLNDRQILLYNEYESSVWTESKYKVYKYTFR
jgi:DNA-binding beta-propeller fold protein YncE